MMLVLRDGIFVNRRHFRELLHRSELKRLVAADLLSREGATHGQGAGHSLTEAGIETLPVVVAMGNTSELAVRVTITADTATKLGATIQRGLWIKRCP